MTWVSGSSAAASRTSDSVRSAWFPSVAKNEKPSRRARAQSRIAVASAPEWDRKAIPPASGMPGANVALSRREGRIHPRQLGPRPGWAARGATPGARPRAPGRPRRPPEIPRRSRSRRGCPSRRTPSGPAGQRAPAPRSPPGRPGSLIARRDGVAGSPWTMSARGFTGQIAALESGRAQVGEDAPADLRRVPGGSHHGDPPRGEKRRERVRTTSDSHRH